MTVIDKKWIEDMKKAKAEADVLRAAGKTTPADGFPDFPPLPAKGDTVAIFMQKKK